jgi:hypothetical protein
MKDLARMRLGVIKEIKNVKRFLDSMERSVKTRNPEAVQRAYYFLVHLVRLMDEGCLTPNNIALDLELTRVFEELDK